MQKPNNYDNTQAQGEFVQAAAGGHYAKVLKVEERLNRNGGDMLVVAFDFASNDDQAGYFMDQFKRDDREDKKWQQQNQFETKNSLGNSPITFLNASSTEIM